MCMHVCMHACDVYVVCMYLELHHAKAQCAPITTNILVWSKIKSTVLVSQTTTKDGEDHNDKKFMKEIILQSIIEKKYLE